MRTTIFDNHVLNKLLQSSARSLFKMCGWRLEGAVPDYRKYVIIAAPHTSNWDFVVAMGVAFAFRLKVYWMGKHTLFRWPFGPVTRWLGGIAVERSAQHNLVAQTVEQFNRHDALIIGIPPEGTRRQVAQWKTGFYYIALQAQVPIVLGFFDYQSKVAGFGPTFLPTGDIEPDMAKIRAFYAPLKGRRQMRASASARM
jgi:1-acyl-sn-glycerol-3-phosphate acyltransferase